MSQETQAPNGSTAVTEQPATLAQLKAACPGASNDFVVEQLEKHSTASSAQREFIAYQQTQIRARDEELTKAKNATPATPVKKPGVQPVGDAGAPSTYAAGAGQSEDPVVAFEALVRQKQASGKKYSAAVSAVVAENPELHQAYVFAKNKGKETLVSGYFAAAAAARN